MSDNNENHEENNHEEEKHEDIQLSSPLANYIFFIFAGVITLFILIPTVLNLVGDDCDVPFADYDGDGSLGISDYDTKQQIKDDAC